MEITKEHIVARLDGLRQGREKLIRDLCATDGAIQECERWFAYLDEAVTISQLAEAIQTGKDLAIPVKET